MTWYSPDFTSGGPIEEQLGTQCWSTFVQCNREDWTGTTHASLWKIGEEIQTPDEFGLTWTGFTVFELSELPSFVDEPEQETFDVTANPARTLHAPTEPTPQQREIHNLTHLPYRTWCEICVKAKGKERPSKKSSDRQPAVQVDYCFVTTGAGCPTVTVLTAVDIQTGYASFVVTPAKGREKYSIAELKRFIFEIGRTYGIVQYDPEPSVKALVTETFEGIGGMSMRATPRDWKQAHGFVGKAQQNFYGQVRAVRLQLQERYSADLTAQSAVYPWIVKHAQFILNRFLTHPDGNTSYFRRWGKNYTSTLCECGETVLFRMPGPLREKGDTAWHTGIWLGRDTEADEHVVFTSQVGIHKVRTIKRQVPSKQWNRELFLKLNSTPWDPKAKNEIDTTFVLPPNLTATRRVREPPGLERNEREYEPSLLGEEQRLPETPDSLLEDLESMPPLESETRLPSEPRVRSPKRTRDDRPELPEDLMPDDKRLTIAYVGVHSVTSRDTDIPVEVNEDETEKQTQLRLLEPQLFDHDPEFPDEDVIPAMQKEMGSMDGFDVYVQVPIHECTQEDMDNALDTRWVKVWKTATNLRVRLVTRGCFQAGMDQDDLFASTPTLVTLRILILMILSRGWICFTCDVSTAFLHAPITERVMLIPPKEFYPEANCLWRLKKAMYGLKQAPALWQQHFCSVMIKLGMRRCKADPNLYCHTSGDLCVLCYVDDLLVCGKQELTTKFTEDLKKEVLLKVEGELKPGNTVNFLGRILKHNGDSIDLTMSPKYIEQTLDLYNMSKAKAAPTTGTTNIPAKPNLDEPLSAEEHKKYRIAVGKLLW